MIPVKEALRRVLDFIPDPQEEIIPLSEAPGRVTAEPITADRPFPPFDRVAMDGIAIQFESYKKGNKRFPIAGIQAAGAPQLKLEEDNACFEVTTGAILPKNTDTVVQYEHLNMLDGEAEIRKKVTEGQNVHLKGFDRGEGDILIKPGRRIGQAEMAVMATVGKTAVKVTRLPSVGIVSTGDELVDVGDIPEPHQIRASNNFALATELKKEGIDSEYRHLKDDPKALRKGLAEMIEMHDLLILSGGVSKGKFDYVPEILEELRINKHFHRVAQRPGKPFWFGTGKDTTVFGLPGNPISGLVCYLKYVRPWILHFINDMRQVPVHVVLSREFSFKPMLTRFLAVRLASHDNGMLHAVPVPGRGSGDLANLLRADGFVELPANEEYFKVGDVYPFHGYRTL